MADDVYGALSEVHRALQTKHPQLSITQIDQNSIDSKPFLHVWKPVDQTNESFQGLKYLPCFHVVVTAEADPERSRDFNVLFQCYSYHGKLLAFDLTWLSAVGDFEFKSLNEMARGSIQICRGVAKSVGDTVDPKAGFVYFWPTAIFEQRAPLQFLPELQHRWA